MMDKVWEPSDSETRKCCLGIIDKKVLLMDNRLSPKILFLQIELYIKKISFAIINNEVPIFYYCKIFMEEMLVYLFYTMLKATLD
jgi:hypothetical protein